MARQWFPRMMLVVLGLCLWPLVQAHATEADVYCGTGTPGPGYWQPASATNPCPVNATVTATATVAVVPLTSTNLSSTIAVTNTFQSIQVLTAGRNGCAVQNNDTNSMWVFFGAIGSATKAKSIVLTTGQSVACAVGGIGVLTDQISITGTATGVFFASVQ